MDSIEELAQFRRTRNTVLVTEDNAALEFAELHRGQLRFCHNRGAWFEWDGTVWRENGTGLAFQSARELTRRLVQEEPDRVRYVSGKTSFASGVEKFAKSDPAFAVTSEVGTKTPFS